MISTLLVLPLAVAAQDFEVPPRETPWSALTQEAFDTNWILPEDPGRRRLLASMRELSVLEFMQGGEPRCFGDLVLQGRRLTSEQRAAWLQGLEGSAPQLMSRWGDSLRELFLDDHLFSGGWDPAEDHARDGILMAEGWEFEARPGAWRSVSKTPRFEQGAALYFADLQTIKEVENDYRAYPANVGADYREIYPAQGKHLTGEDPGGDPFRFMQIYFKCDLPFPFSSYECDLRILNRMDEAGVLRTDIYSESRDFIYMAGQDVFLPVVESNGETVAYLVVRDFGFDLSGVPDGPGHRAQALRSTLGNMKRNTQARFRSGDDAFAPATEILGDIRVRGSK